jgi:predicted ATPase
VNDYGKPFAVAGFGNKFREWCNEAGLPRRGSCLRKTAATIAAENGATAHEPMAIFGRMRLAMNAHVGDGGQLLLAGPEHDEKETEACMQKALSVARRQRFKLGELVAATSLARLWLQQGNSRAALALLQPIYASFTEGFEFPVLRDARVLLDELSKP